MTIVSSSSRRAVLSRASQEQLAITERIRITLLKKLANEQLAVYDTVTKTAVISRPISVQQLSMTDAISASQILSRTAKEQLLTSDSRARIAIVARPIPTEQLSLSDTLSSARSFVRNLSEALTLASSTTVKSFKSVADNMGATDQLVRTTVIGRANFESLAIQEKIRITVSKSFTEQLTLVDLVWNF
jgi:sRNA-binding carbon storage regulator CsrA